MKEISTVATHPVTKHTQQWNNYNYYLLFRYALNDNNQQQSSSKKTAIFVDYLKSGKKKKKIQDCGLTFAEDKTGKQSATENYEPRVVLWSSCFHVGWNHSIWNMFSDVKVEGKPNRRNCFLAYFTKLKTKFRHKGCCWIHFMSLHLLKIFNSHRWGLFLCDITLL